MYMPFTFARFFVFALFFCQCVFFLLLAASYNGLMPPLAACTVDVYYLCYVLGK